MMRKILVITIIFITTMVISTLLYIKRTPSQGGVVPMNVKTVFQMATPTPTKPLYQDAAISAKVTLPYHTFQSFNNCGPATLSMILAFHNSPRPQEELGQELRPYQNPQGDNDDKSVSLPELAAKAEEFGFVTYYRPNATIEKLKLLLSNGFPIIAVTWLHHNEDIGHYRIITGYSDAEQKIIQSDSYQSKESTYSYDEFFSLWQPFNYRYLIITSKDKEELLRAILGEEVDAQRAWENAYARAEKEKNTSSFYATFNLATSSYYLKNYTRAIEEFESIEKTLPSRMLWYQIEPIEAYYEAGNYEKVFSLTQTILDRNNRAYSELYLIRGKSYKKLGQIDLARKEFEKAIYYNKNYREAEQELATL